jgi:hypothetical protein
MSELGAAMDREAQMKAGILAMQRIFLIRGLSMRMSPLKKVERLQILASRKPQIES